MAMQLVAPPTVVGGHHRLHAGGESGAVAGGMESKERFFRTIRVALVAPARSRALADEVLCRGDDTSGAEKALRAGDALQRGDHARCVFRHDVGMLGVAFVGSAPAVVAWHGERRREGPIDACRGHFKGGGGADGGNEVGIAGGAEADVVGEHRGAVYVRVSMHGVGAPEDRHTIAVIRFRGGVVEGIGKLHPVAHACMFVAAREAAAAVEDGTQAIGASFCWSDACDFRLHHLPHLLLQGEVFEVASDGPRVGFGQAQGWS